MDCPSCAGKVDKSLQRVDGIVDVGLQPTTGTAIVTYDSDRTSQADVVAAIEGAGYEVMGSSDAESNDMESDDGIDIAPPSEVWTSSRAIKTWAGGAFVAVGLLFEFLLTAQNLTVASVLGYPLSIADVLLLGAVVISGYPVVRNGYYSAKNLSLDIDLLIGTAIIAASGKAATQTRSGLLHRRSEATPRKERVARDHLHLQAQPELGSNGLRPVRRIHDERSSWGSS